MSGLTPDETGETPSIEVRVYSRGKLVYRQRCETESDAADVMDQWSELGDVSFQVDDLAEHDRIEYTEGVATEPNAEL